MGASLQRPMALAIDRAVTAAEPLYTSSHPVFLASNEDI